METGVILTVIGTGVSVVGLVYTIIRNFKNDIDIKFTQQEERIFKHLAIQDERIFLLATGKTLKEAMMEDKKNDEARKTT